MLRPAHCVKEPSALKVPAARTAASSWKSAPRVERPRRSATLWSTVPALLLIARGMCTDRTALLVTRASSSASQESVNHWMLSARGSFVSKMYKIRVNIECIVPFIHSFIRSFVDSFIHLFVHHPLYHPYIHSSIHPFIHPSIFLFFHSFIHSFILPMLFVCE